MKRVISLFPFVVGLLIAGCAPGDSAARDKPPIELLNEPLTPAIALQCFKEARAVCEKDGGRLWGVCLSAPVLLVDPETRRVIASRADREGFLSKQGEVFIGTLPVEETIAGTAITWAGVKWVMLPWPLAKHKSERLHMFTHEAFHCVQPKLGLSVTMPGNHHLDARDGRIWLQLEWRALKAALTANGNKRQRAIADALTFRAYRRSLFPKAAEEERAMETVEGLAEYTGVRLSSDSDASMVARALKNFEYAKDWPTFVQSFAYVSGPAYGHLLDQARPDWREGLTADHDLGQLLQQALSISLPDDLEAEAQRRAAGYDVERLVTAENKRANTGRARLAQYRLRFIDGPLLIIPIHNMQFRYDPRNIQPLDDLGKVYPKMRMTDAWGILDVTGGGALVAADWSKVVVPAPGDPNARPLRGDGWTLELGEKWELRTGPRKGDYIVKRSEHDRE